MYTWFKMKEENPFQSISILLPDDIVGDNDATVASYWKKGDTCLLQLSSFLREQGPQVSAADRLAQRMRAGGEWEAFDLPRQIEGCESAAASTTDSQGTSWVHIYLVWRWLALHVTVSGQGIHQTCDWAWNALFSIRPINM
jgi:hypothetical protein